jgi:cytochrome c oxidase subunit 2
VASDVRALESENVMHIHRYERWWMTAGIGMLIVFLVIILVAAFADNANPPSDMMQIDPTKVASTPPFDKPGLRALGGGRYEAYYVAQVFSFTPSVLHVPVGATVTFYATSPDVVHGFEIAQTNVDMTVVPGWVNSVTHTFGKAGTYLLLCNEFCGVAHQAMYATIEVK